MFSFYWYKSHTEPLRCIKVKRVCMSRCHWAGRGEVRTTVVGQVQVWLDCSLVRWATFCCQLDSFLIFFFSFFFHKCVGGGWRKALIAAPSCLHEYCSHQQDSSAARLHPSFIVPCFGNSRTPLIHARVSHAEATNVAANLNERGCSFTICATFG